MCLICQEEATETLKYPLKAKGSGDKSEAYSSFLNKVSAFRALGTLPVVLNFGQHMTVGELIQNQGARHKSCYVKFSKEKLERATKKRSREAGSNIPEKKDLHEFRTLGADVPIRQMARELEETKLMARMEGHRSYSTWS